MVILRSVIRVSKLNTCMVLFGNGTIINLFIYQFSASFTYGTIQMSVVLYDSKYVLLKPMVLSRNGMRGDPPVLGVHMTARPRHGLSFQTRIQLPFQIKTRIPFRAEGPRGTRHGKPSPTSGPSPSHSPCID